jgi:hypothetical protein
MKWLKLAQDHVSGLELAVPTEKRKVNMSPRLTRHHAMKTYLGSGGIAPRILNVGTKWR